MNLIYFINKCSMWELSREYIEWHVILILICKNKQKIQISLINSTAPMILWLGRITMKFPCSQFMWEIWWFKRLRKSQYGRYLEIPRKGTFGIYFLEKIYLKAIWTGRILVGNLTIQEFNLTPDLERSRISFCRCLSYHL